MKINSRELSSNVNFVELDNKKYVLKKMLNCFDEDFCKRKNKYIKFLKDNGINVPQTSTVKINNQVFEIQEYIDGMQQNLLNLNVFKYLAQFHNISKKYGKSFNKRLYINDTYIKNIKLEKLLIGFKEKYYRYPLKSLEKLNLDKELKKTIKQLLVYLYKSFILKFGIEDCIIHNDLTSNNYILLKNNKYAFIDFDLSIMSSVYVDIGDLIFTRDYNIADYKLIFSQKKEIIESYLKMYNKFSEKKVNFKGLLNFAALKLFSYYLYIHSKIKSIDLVELNDVLDFAQTVKEELK